MEWDAGSLINKTEAGETRSLRTALLTGASNTTDVLKVIFKEALFISPVIFFEVIASILSGS
jgi:hypothetical protein